MYVDLHITCIAYGHFWPKQYVGICVFKTTSCKEATIEHLVQLGEDVYGTLCLLGCASLSPHA